MNWPAACSASPSANACSAAVVFPTASSMACRASSFPASVSVSISSSGSDQPVLAHRLQVADGSFEVTDSGRLVRRVFVSSASAALSLPATSSALSASGVPGLASTRPWTSSSTSSMMVPLNFDEQAFERPDVAALPLRPGDAALIRLGAVCRHGRVDRQAVREQRDGLRRPAVVR